jgi:repressor LexA
MSPDPLTPKQKIVLDFILKFMNDQGYAPSIAEICQGLNLSSTATVHKHLQMLISKGHIHSLPRRSRGLMSPQPATRPTSQAVEIPLLGSVSAGRPIEANETHEAIELPEWMLGRDETYVLRVKGESMIDEAIKDGDLIIVEKRAVAQNGEMVVACIGNEEVTLKRLYREGEQVRLQPSNPAMMPIYVAARELSIKGIVIGILRKYKRM